MSDLDKLKQWVESGAAKPPKGETVEKIIKRIDRISKPKEEKK
jgi:hypothetical protein